MNNNEFTKNAIEEAILLGAFGEMLLEGIIGLFVGAIYSYSSGYLVYCGSVKNSG